MLGTWEPAVTELMSLQLLIWCCRSAFVLTQNYPTCKRCGHRFIPRRNHLEACQYHCGVSILIKITVLILLNDLQCSQELHKEFVSCICSCIHVEKHYTPKEFINIAKIVCKVKYVCRIQTNKVILIFHKNTIKLNYYFDKLSIILLAIVSYNHRLINIMFFSFFHVQLIYELHTIYL